MKIVEPRLVTLWEVLGMSKEDGNRIVDNVLERHSACDGSAELCERIVAEYGVEAVYTSMCAYILLEHESREISGGMSHGS